MNAKKAQGYDPMYYYNTDPELKLAIDRISSGFFSHGDPTLFKPLLDTLLYHDEYMLLADYRSYVECQELVSQAYRDAENWTRMTILNVARMGKFSSDRSIWDYCQDIWKIQPIKIELGQYAQVDVNQLKISL